MGNAIPDWLKVALAVASIVGATTGTQYLGWTRPASIDQSETALTQATIHQQLRECYQDLKACYTECRALR